MYDICVHACNRVYMHVWYTAESDNFGSCFITVVLCQHAGPSRPVKPPSQASSASGSAAIARIEGQNQKKSSSQAMKKKVGIPAAGGGGGQMTEGRRLDSQVTFLSLSLSLSL